MSIAQDHIEFKFRLDKLDALNYPNFLPEEIDLLLNQAQDRIVKQRYGTTNSKRQSFEETQKRTEDLKDITVNALLTPLANATDNIDPKARFVVLPTDHWFIVQERCDVTYLDCNNATVTDTIEVTPINHSEFTKTINDAFKKPGKDKVLRLMENGRVELVFGTGITGVLYRLRYIKEPRRVSLVPPVNFEFSSYLITEIIDEAVKIALEAIEANRTQTFTPIINNTNE